MESRNRYSPHLTLAKNHWQSHLKPDDFAIDMTCGNGHDTKFLTELLPYGIVFSVDIQEISLQKARELVGDCPRVRFFKQCHSQPLEVPCKPRLIVYNLGYLPGGDKSITTQSESTLRSLGVASELLDMGGALSITCYPGHDEGKREEGQVTSWARALDPSKWRVSHTQWINREFAPSLLWIQKLPVKYRD